MNIRILGAAARAGIVGLAVLALPACETVEDILGTGEEEVRLTGTRIPILAVESGIAADSSLADLDITLPAPRVNDSWPQAGAIPSHAIHHLAASEAPQKIWEAGIGRGTGSRTRLMAPPVVAEGRVFTMDSEGAVSAIDAESGSTLWAVSVTPEGEEALLGGGLAYDAGRLYVTTGAGEALSLDAGSGALYWRQRMKGLIRSAPTVYAGRLFAVTVDSQLQVLDIRDGRELWSHAGISELASILGYASPAAEGNTVIAAYPSGEVFAFRIDTGNSVWNDALMSVRRVDAISALGTIRGQPVIYDNTVYVVGHSGRMVAIDLRTGSRVWEQNFGGIETPWVAGDFIYLLTSDAEILCIERKSGGVRWVAHLPLWNDLEDREDPILWSGPALVGDRLIVVGNNGIIATFSPYSSELLGTLEFDDEVSMAPVVANGTIYFLTDDAELVAYR